MLDTIMIFFAKYLYLLIVLIGIIFVLQNYLKKKKNALALALLSFPTVLIIAKISSYFFYDTRPFVVHHFIPLVEHAADNGFPSDHALLSFAIASMVFIFNKRLGLILFALGLLVGISRVYVGIHNLIDILGSLIISIVVSIIFNYLLRFYERRKL